MRFSSTVSTCRKAGCEDPGCLGVRELPPGRARTARRRIDACGVQDLPHCGRRDRNAELGELTVDAAVSPQRILPRQADGKAGDAPDCRGQAGLALLACVVPFRGQLAVPGQQRRGRDRKDLAPAPARYEPCQRSEPGPVSGLVPHPGDVAAQYRVLVAQDQQLRVLGQVTTEQHDQQTRHGTDDQINEGEDHPRWSQAERHDRG